jgi:cytochrome c-type protein NapC
MKWNLEEYKETVHYRSASGVRAICSDCHVPKPLIPKLIAKVMAAKDVFHEIIGTINTKEKFEKHRWEMAQRVWAKMKATDSRECRSCHDFTSMDLSEQDRLARKKHGKAVEKGKTCIDCHKGIAHEDPEEPEEDEEEAKTSWYNFNFGKLRMKPNG